MKKIELSVIIPVYNVEKYVEKCIESVLQIKNINYEIILVNDGSTDSSGIICKQAYEKNPDIIKLINQKNQGLSESRNNGIKNAIGEYIYFLDSDDYIEADKFYEDFQKLKEFKPDILYFGYYYETEQEKIERYSYISTPNKLYETKTFLKHELKNRNLPAAVCFGIYRKDLIIKNKLFFQKGILHEDERWSPITLLKTNKIYVSENIVYHYVQRENSIMHKKDKTKNGIDMVDTCNYLEEHINKIEDKELKKVMKNRQAMLYMKGTVIGKLHRIKYRKKINRFFPIKHAYTKYDKIKGLIYMISPTIYYYTAKVIKG